MINGLLNTVSILVKILTAFLELTVPRDINAESVYIAALW